MGRIVEPKTSPLDSDIKTSLIPTDLEKYRKGWDKAFKYNQNESEEKSEDGKV